MVQNREKWRADVNTVMNFGGSQKCREFFDWLKNC